MMSVGRVHKSDTGSRNRPAAIELRGVRKAYGLGRFAKDVVRDCSLTVAANRMTVLIGPSGAGKSTLIRLIAGFEKPDEGVIIVDGKPVTGPGSNRLVVFQESALFPWMTAEQNVVYGPTARGESYAAARRGAAALLERVGLTGFRGHYPRQLSGGMQRRVELARALVNNPAIMILDEPFRGLDAMTRRLMLDYYARLASESCRTNLFVTTDIDEAIFLADTVVVMSHLPTHVRRVIEVNLSKPRDYTALFQDDRANAIKVEALALLHEEAMRAFAGGSRAAADFVESYRRRIATA